jgi:hypothetical protein
MHKYEEYKVSRTSWGIGVLGSIFVKLTASDGTVGYATGFGGPPACWLIEEHFKRFVIGQDPRDTNKIWDMMWRASMFYGRKGESSAGRQPEPEPERSCGTLQVLTTRRGSRLTPRSPPRRTLCRRPRHLGSARQDPRRARVQDDWRRDEKGHSALPHGAQAGRGEKARVLGQQGAPPARPVGRARGYPQECRVPPKVPGRRGARLSDSD